MKKLNLTVFAFRAVVVSICAFLAFSPDWIGPAVFNLHHDAPVLRLFGGAMVIAFLLGGIFTVARMADRGNARAIKLWSLLINDLFDKR